VLDFGKVNQRNGVLYVKLIGEVGVVVDMSLAAFVVCMCEREFWLLVNGGQRREALGSGCGGWDGIGYHSL
jgi:hypothetical protein